MSVAPDSGKFRVLFVCTGNICRSPTAEAVFRELVAKQNLHTVIDCDSAGTHGYHVGEGPDGRAIAAALNRGYAMAELRGRQIAESDYASFHLVLGMDRQNMKYLRERCPPEQGHKLSLLLDYSGVAPAGEVPDPYYGPKRGFEVVLDLIERGCTELLARVRRELRV